MKILASAIFNGIPYSVVDTILSTDMLMFQSVILPVEGKSYCAGVECEECVFRQCGCGELSFMTRQDLFNELFPALKTDHPELYI
jgi:hypothetical protein